jgi:hypothetical protein
MLKKVIPNPLQSVAITPARLQSNSQTQKHQTLLEAATQEVAAKVHSWTLSNLGKQTQNGKHEKILPQSEAQSQRFGSMSNDWMMDTPDLKLWFPRLAN